MDECRPVSNPILKDNLENEKEHRSIKTTNFQYREAVGSLMYLMLVSYYGLVKDRVQFPSPPLKQRSSLQVRLFVDINTAIKLAENPLWYKRTKHISVRHFFVREKEQEGEIHIQILDAQDQLPDGLEYQV
ncbi:uncharacterized protein [Halyomorpha halys]|uniref:uncharacterized protein n=1 Tax=Halyomorpha halys TaxID=286706 RepID=UPI0034D36649